VRSAYHIVRQVLADVTHRVLLPLCHVLEQQQERAGHESAAQSVQAFSELSNRLVLSEGVPDESCTTRTLSPSNNKGR
jgi:hypothetical protein